MRRPVDDAGSGTVLVLTATAAVAALATLLAALGLVAVARHRAASAADLAALAAAGAASRGAGYACAAAARTAAAAGATLVSCRVDGLTAEVIAAVRPGGRLGRLGVVRVAARAGPGPPAGVPAAGEPVSGAQAREQKGTW